jgi:hypothetical protein
MRVELLGVTAFDEKGVQTGLMPVELLDTFWPRIEELLDKLPHTWEGYTKNYFYDAISAHKVQVWLAAKDEKIRFCLFTRVGQLPAYRTLELFWASGEGMPDQAAPTLEAVLDEFAVRQGCTEIQVIGRRGWEKILKKWGFRHMATVWSRPVVDRRAH